MKKLILTREERTQAIIDGWRDLPGEFYMLKGLLCMENTIEQAAEKKGATRQQAREERDQFKETFNDLMIAERMDEVRAENTKKEIARLGGPIT